MRLSISKLIVVGISLCMFMLSACNNAVTVQTSAMATEKSTEETNNSVVDIILVKNEEIKEGYSNEGAPIKASYENITISDSQVNQYPNLKKVLDNRNNDLYNIIVDSYNSFLKYPPYMANASATYEETITAEIARSDSNIVSIIDTEYSFTGGTHPNTDYKTYNYDPKTGSEIYLTDIITDEDVFLSKLDELAKIQSSNSELFTLPSDSIRNTGLGNINFTVGKNEFKIYFPPYALASYASGSFILAVPFSEVSDNINPKYLEHT